MSVAQQPVTSVKTCDVPDCGRKTLQRTYCIRCEINGQAQQHEESSRG